jgi:SAM-dependent methyltransferase
MTSKITESDIIEAIGEDIPSLLREKLNGMDLTYEELSKDENNDVLYEILNFLFKEDDHVVRAGEHRINDWNKGWGENAKEFSEHRHYNSLIPKYFGKYPYIRWNKNIIKPCNKNMEYNMVQILQYWAFDKFLKDCDNIYEFGCGTGHNLFRAREVNPTAKITGLDWSTSSQESINQINNILGLDFGSHRFDFFNVDKEFKLGQKSGIYTFAALEQINNRYYDFINYLMDNNADICLHIEPMGEYLDDGNIYDFLSKKYFEKRNYLKGFKDCLYNLEREGKIEIVYEKSSFIGSMFINGYSIVAWRKK